MEETKKFYSQKAIAIATYFGGPLAAGYLVKKNYEALELPDSAKKALFIGIVSTVLLFAGIFSVPEQVMEKVPNFLIPAIYTVIIYLIVEKFQGESLKLHKESGGEFYSGWKAAGVGAIAMVILAAGIFLTAFLAGDFSGTGSAYDAAAYDLAIDKFTENETRALQVFDALETDAPEYLIGEFVKGRTLWQENRDIIKGLMAMEDLPQELSDQNALLLKYCSLRIQHYDIFVRSFSENTNIYTPEIDRIGLEIKKVLEEL